MRNLWQDLRYGLRMLGKNPGFTAITVLALTLGIGVNTAIFTAYNAVALRPLQAKDAGRVVNVYRSSAEDRWGEGFTYSDYAYYRDHNAAFSGLIATADDELVLSGAPGATIPASTWGGGIATIAGFRFPQAMAGSAEFISSAMVSENYFSLLGIDAIRGRTFVPEIDDVASASPTVMLSYNFWQRRFGSDLSLLGRTIKLNNASFTVIGITPNDFMGTQPNVPDVWLPMSKQGLVQPGDEWLHKSEEYCCRINGRLKPGVTMEQAQAELTVLTEQVRQTHPSGSNLSKPASILLGRGTPFLGRPNTAFTTAAIFTMGAVGLVLLIACANVASLQLARSVARRKEFGVRLAVGASRARLIRQMLTEGSLLAMLAGCLGLLLSWWALRFLVQEISASLPTVWGTIALHVDPDIRIFGYTLIVSLVAGVLFGLAPALEASKPNLTSVLKEEGAGLVGRQGKSRLRDLLVTAQVAICLLLLIVAALLVRGSIRALNLDPGFETKRVLAMGLELPPGFAYSQAKLASMIQQLMDRFRTVPGVVSVSRGRTPLSGGMRTTSVAVEGHKLLSGGRAVEFYYNYVPSNYFETLSIPVVQGRTFTEQESRAGAPVAVISEATAKKLWPGRDPIGKQLVLDASDQFHAGGPFPVSRVSEVIGITKDIRSVSLSDLDESCVFLPIPPDEWYEEMFVRTQGDPRSAIATLGKEVQAVDPNVTVFAEPLDGVITGTPSFMFSRLGAIFSTAVGLLGLLLASIGIFGMVSYAVVQRTREIGIRMALGANGHDVLGLILWQSLKPVAFGMAIGLTGAALASRLLGALLFGLGSLDPAAFVASSLFLALVTVLASYIPARRAMKTDPMVALRYE